MFTPIFVLGVPVHEQQGQPSQILMSWSLQDLTNYICQSYPVVSLNLVGFHMAKVNRCRSHNTTSTPATSEAAASAATSIHPELICKTEADFWAIKSELGDWLSDCGLSFVYTSSIQDVERIVKGVIKHFAFLRVPNMVTEFTGGMDEVGNYGSAAVKRLSTAYDKSQVPKSASYKLQSNRLQQKGGGGRNHIHMGAIFEHGGW
ncbi:hypothetical protein SKAU_G00392880 [Synaphobranchus kaupii]|uniref:Uncharacterized protein n=1 Tax=Synaphobranchus kaupii TaxID=118154 RepID=A0A9Q1EBZ4_SYNKA|nr:hypothetical protein SKAU_G00392880 [Synaphobranchus kaupii]